MLLILLKVQGAALVNLDHMSHEMATLHCHEIKL